MKRELALGCVLVDDMNSCKGRQFLHNASLYYSIPLASIVAFRSVNTVYGRKRMSRNEQNT
jgi:hypothetical protein